MVAEKVDQILGANLLGHEVWNWNSLVEDVGQQHRVDVKFQLDMQRGVHNEGVCESRAWKFFDIFTADTLHYWVNT